MRTLLSRRTTPYLGVPFEVNRCSNQASGLIGWWPMIGQRGAILRDYAGRAADGTLSGDAVVVPDGVMGSAISLDGTGDFAAMGTVPQLGAASDCTITAWINPATSILLQGIAGDLGAGGSSSEMMLMRNQTANRTSVYWGTSYVVVGARNVLANSGWHHVAATRTGATGAWTATLYLDGTLDNTASTAVNPAALQPFAIGRLGGYALQYWFNGRIGDVRKYARALSPAEIWQLWAPETRWELYAPSMRYWPGYVASGLARSPIGSGVIGSAMIGVAGRVVS